MQGCLPFVKIIRPMTRKLFFVGGGVHLCLPSVAVWGVGVVPPPGTVDLRQASIMEE